MRFVALLLRTLAALTLTLVCADALVRVALPREPRLEDNFSPAYLQRALAGDGLDRKTVFLGDSALWGYGLGAGDAALTRMMRAGIPVENLAFEGGSVANTYALLRLMQSDRIRPKAIVFNVNLKEFNAADSAYRTLYPGLEQLTSGMLTADQRRLLQLTQQATTDSWIDHSLSKVWALYGMRSDIREMAFGDADAASALAAVVHAVSGETARYDATHVATPDRFLGTYDLAPLTRANVEVRFLEDTGALLRAERIPAYAVLTPTNHTLLHDYIDVPEYTQQLSYVARVLRAYGIVVLNYDRAFSAAEFLDNDHLTAAGNVHLAALLRDDIPL